MKNKRGKMETIKNVHYTDFFDIYKSDWAMVTINGKVGFIDNKGNYIEKK